MVILGNLFELSSNKYVLSSNKYSNKYRNLEFVQIQIQIRKKWPNLVQINTNTNTNKIWTQPWCGCIDSTFNIDVSLGSDDSFKHVITSFLLCIPFKNIKLTVCYFSLTYNISCFTNILKTWILVIFRRISYVQESLRFSESCSPCFIQY